MKQNLNYGVIGNNWGEKIYKILKNKKKVFRFKSYKNFTSYKKYLAYIKDETKKNSIDIFWVAINPFQNLELVKFLITNKKHLVIEKPWVHNKKNTSKVIKLCRLNKVKIFIHFEFIFLKKLKNLDTQKKIEAVHLDFLNKQKKQSRVPKKQEFCSHLMAIKLLYFANIKKCTFNFGYHLKKNIRRVVIKYKNKFKIIDYSKTNEDIIGKFIRFVENSINKNQKNYLDLKFASRVNHELKKIN